MIRFEQLVEGLLRGEKLIEAERRKRDAQKESQRKTCPQPEK